MPEAETDPVTNDEIRQLWEDEAQRLLDANHESHETNEETNQNDNQSHSNPVDEKPRQPTKMETNQFMRKPPMTTIARSQTRMKVLTTATKSETPQHREMKSTRHLIPTW